MDTQIIVDPVGLRNVVPEAIYNAGRLPTFGGRDILIGVYTIRNLETGSCYVGSSIDIYRRLRAHLSTLRRSAHYSTRLQTAWDKRGESAFAFVVERVFESHAEALAFEEYILTAGKPAYNSALVPLAGFKGRHHTPESKAKLSAAMTGKIFGPRTFTEAHRKALSDAAPRSYPERIGVKRTDKTRVQMSESAKAKFAAGFVNGRTRAVEIGGVIYSSGKAAAVALGITQGGICSRIKRGHGRYL